MLDEPFRALSPLRVRGIGRVVVDINQAGTSIILMEQKARVRLYWREIGLRRLIWGSEICVEGG